MPMRCSTARDQGATNPYGTGQDYQSHLSAVPCYWWVRTGREDTDSQRSVVLADEHLIADHDADIRPGDRILSLTDHEGRPVFGSDDYREVQHVAIERTFIDCSLRATSGSAGPAS